LLKRINMRDYTEVFSEKISVNGYRTNIRSLSSMRLNDASLKAREVPDFLKPSYYIKNKERFLSRV